AAAASARHLHAAGSTDVFPIEEIECGQADIRHLLFAENEAMVGQTIVGLRDVGGRHRRRGCAADQREAEAGGTQHTDGGGLAGSFWCRSLLGPWHDGVLQNEMGSTE